MIKITIITAMVYMLAVAVDFTAYQFFLCNMLALIFAK